RPNFNVVAHPRTSVQRLELDSCRNRIEWYREINRSHLTREQRLDVLFALIRAMHPNTALGVVQRREKRNALDVIPVKVCEEKINLDRFAARLQLLAKHPNAGACIEDERTPAGCLDLKTRRVTAKTCRTRARTRDRAARAPAR